MNVSFQWLQDYVDLNGVDPKELAEKITRSGIEVDSVKARSEGISGVVIGHVVEREKHPDADKLSVTKVDVGGPELLQIVCGASNVAAGQNVPIAMIGAVLPGDFKIKKSKLRGVESQGMICSANELGIPEKFLSKTQKEGILVLPADAPIGSDALEYLGLNDQVLEFDLTPNRSDCLSMWGCAFEVAALLEKPVKLPHVVIHEDTTERASDLIQVSIEDAAPCLHYSARIIRDVVVKPSPQWMQNRLVAAGIRPISNVVDITNYVLLEYGQPLHAFDLSKLKHGEINVRYARSGEAFVTLDGVTRELDESMMVISDGFDAVALGGVMGGQDTEVNESTNQILLESARFDGGTVRLTSKKLGLRSESSVRFEKEVDPARVRLALDRAAALLAQYAGGRVISGVVETFKDENDRVLADVDSARRIHISNEKINLTLGTNLSSDEIAVIWSRLQFKAELHGEHWEVCVPSRRNDIRLAIDLIEEVARLYGYDRIPTSFIVGKTTTGALTNEQIIRRRLRGQLAAQGWHEVLTYSLTEPKTMQAFPVAGKHGVVTLAMPMSEERSVLRHSIIPALIEAAQYNRNRQLDDVRIFEVGHVFLGTENANNALPNEQLMLGLLWTGSKSPRHWSGKPQAIDFFDFKGQLETLFEKLGLTGLIWESSVREGFHPGRTAQVSVKIGEGVDVLGTIGQLHPDQQRAMDLSDTYVAELSVSVVVEAARRGVQFQALPKYPAISRDMALVLDRSVSVDTVIRETKALVGDLVESIRVFDVYEDEKLGRDKRSVAFSLLYRVPERTLTDEEVSQRHFGMVEKLNERFGAVLRA